jgi:hypothetical protein
VCKFQVLPIHPPLGNFQFVLSIAVYSLVHYTKILHQLLQSTRIHKLIVTTVEEITQEHPYALSLVVSRLSNLIPYGVIVVNFW